MNTQMMNPPDVSDADLVEQSRAGVAAAFGRLVERHQSLVCSVALGACGDLHRSEDIAQEAFVGAWRQLGELKEPGSFRSWVCGIARNIANSSIRRDDRTPTALAGEASGEEVQVEAATPADHAIDSEERAILLRQLQDLPPLYREPMVLFYRKNESVASVAEVLGISEDAVKQRLSRGRALLAERVERSLGAMLRRSAPGGTFTLAVLGAVASIPVPAGAATAGGSLAKATASHSAGGMMAPFVAMAGVTVGLWNIMKGHVDDAKSTGERRFMIRAFMWMTIVCSAFGLMVGVLAAIKPGFAALLCVGTPVMTGLLVWPLGLWIKRRRHEIRKANSLTSVEQEHQETGKPQFRRTIAGMIVAVGFFPSFLVGLFGMLGPETLHTAIFAFLATCAGIVLVFTAVIWHWPARYRAVLLAHFTSLLAATLVLALFVRENLLRSGNWEAHRSDFNIMIALALSGLMIIWIAWAIYTCFGRNNRQDSATPTS
jgi:RNA polymerase sigma factor (sigma-70 family)